MSADPAAGLEFIGATRIESECGSHSDHRSPTAWLGWEDSNSQKAFSDRAPNSFGSGAKFWRCAKRFVKL